MLEALHVETSETELCRRHNITESQLSQWQQQAVEHLATASEKLFVLNRALDEVYELANNIQVVLFKYDDLPLKPFESELPIPFSADS